MGRLLNKESCADSERDGPSDPAVMRKAIVVTLIALGLVVVLMQPDEGEQTVRTVEAAPQEVVEETPPTPQEEQNIKKELTLQQKIDQNVNNCTKDQWIRADNAECITKAPEPVERVASPVSTPAPVTGDWVADCHRWAKMAGINLPPAAISLIGKESKCNPTARNPSSSAGGIPQALPWTKMGCGIERTDAVAVCQLKWMHGYVMSVYGSWEAADTFQSCTGLCYRLSGPIHKSNTWY